ncbi:MAG: hypothetical protein JSR86_05835 [Proteobacteria bacterium]|nr:hypothetical protein [Pseudomonadota bacterium]
MILPANSVVLERVIYSGSHAGDELELALVPALADELRRLSADCDTELRRFVRSMTDLVEAAFEQDNPICF